MILSLNEIDAECRKAARGAGLSWGMAEEVGKAARWLALHDQPGPAMLAMILTTTDDSVASPFVRGTSLLDFAPVHRFAEPVALGETGFPLLVVPWAARAAAMLEHGLIVEWPGATVEVGANGGAALSGADLHATRCPSITARLHEPKTALAMPVFGGRAVPEEALAILRGFSHRTYAPATEESRNRGAG